MNILTMPMVMEVKAILVPRTINLFALFLEMPLLLKSVLLGAIVMKGQQQRDLPLLVRAYFCS